MPELEDEDCSDCQWWVGQEECDICGYRCVGVVPIAMDQTEPIVPLQCGDCMNFSAHPAD